MSESLLRANLASKVFFLLLALQATLAAAAAEPLAAGPTLKHSDVVFMGAASKDLYDIYGATVVSWGGRAYRDDARSINEFRRRVQEAHDFGIRYSSGAAFRTAFAGMIDFDPQWRDSLVLTIERQPMTIPWLWDQKHKAGHPAYWFCTNAPGYREYLKWQVRMAMAAPVEGLHIDDYNGTAGTEYHGACFCPHCMKAFTAYLKKNVAAERLRKCGIASLDGFEYGEFLRGKGVSKTDDFRRALGSPALLGPEFLRFQYFAAAEFVGEVKKYAQQLAGHPLLLSVNSSASDPKSLVIAPYLGFFCGEVDHGAENSAWGPKANRDLQSVWSFKLADSVGRFQACTGSGGDWAYVDAHKKPGLVRTWIALDYAFGHCLMAPHHQWAYTKEKGTHWYKSQPDDYAHVYRFVRRNSELFDDYQSVAPVGLLYSSAGARKSAHDVRDAALWLAKHNIPFEIVLSGDEWLDARLTRETLAKYRALVVAEPTLLDGPQKQAVDGLAAAGKIVKWDAAKRMDEAALRRLLPAPIAMSGSENIVAVARAKPGEPAAPAIIHLLNRNYVESNDATTSLRNVKIELRRDLFGRSFTKATLYAPPPALDRKTPGASTPVPLALQTTAEGVTITIPELGFWGIVTLSEK